MIKSEFNRGPRLSQNRMNGLWCFWAEWLLIPSCLTCEVLPSKLDRFLSTIDVLWEKIAALIEFL